MSGKSAGIPSTQSLAPEVRQVLDPLIEIVESATGRRTKNLPKLTHLPANASLAEVIAAHNALLDRLQR